MAAYQAVEFGGVARVKPDAAVGRGAAEALDVVAAVDRVTALEEDRMRHRRPVVFARIMHSLQPFGAIAADRCAIPPARCRNLP